MTILFHFGLVTFGLYFWRKKQEIPYVHGFRTDETTSPQTNYFSFWRHQDTPTKLKNIPMSFQNILLYDISQFRKPTIFILLKTGGILKIHFLFSEILSLRSISSKKHESCFEKLEYEKLEQRALL